MPYRDSWSDLVGSRFWIAGSVSTYQTFIEQSNVGIYMFGGFKDDFRRELIVAYSNLHNRSKLLIGPWMHCLNQGFDLVTERLRFFDYWLKDIDNGIMSEQPIEYYTTGAPAGSEWQTTDQWPLRSERPTDFYFEAGKSLGEKKPAEGTDSFQVNYDLGKELPTVTSIYSPPGPQDEKGITYTTPPLASAMELTGHPIVHLWMASTATDDHVFAYLEDVDADGKAAIVTDGRLRASLRKLDTAPYKLLGLPYHRSFVEDAQPLAPGQPAELVFDMLPLSQVFAAGHRIRLTITGADPREKDRPETTPPPTITIFHDAMHASFVTLPVIPSSH